MWETTRQKRTVFFNKQTAKTERETYRLKSSQHITMYGLYLDPISTNCKLKRNL